MKEVIPIRYPQEEILGGFNPLNMNVYYSEHLDRPEFAKLKEFVLKHETQHFKKPFNIFWHIYIDARDYPKHLISRDVYDYDKMIRKEYYQKKPWWWMFGMSLCTVANMFLALFLLIPQVVAGWIYKYQDYRREKIERSKCPDCVE